jgi:O-antigen/teichoic acid export membrane protein
MKLINSQSVSIRVITSILFSGLKAVLGFISTMIVARHLSPSGYGDLMFLFGTFVSLRPLFDMGVSNAFFTFLSQGKISKNYFLFYFLWLGLQFILMTSLIFIILPTEWYERIWIGHDRASVFLAFFAVFMQQQVWQTLLQIGEAFRQTVRVQFASLMVAFIYLASLILLGQYLLFTPKRIFLLQIVQYSIAAAIFYLYTKGRRSVDLKSMQSFKLISLQFFHYCRPLIVVTLSGFLYEFLDKWMLQKYAGSAQQGFFQISNQFASLSLLITTSVMSIFWREFSELWSRGDSEKMSRLYSFFLRCLVMISASISGFLIPWSAEIISIILGPPYSDASIILAIALLYPIHQAMGQVCGVVFLASGETKKYMVISTLIMLISIPVTYFLLAPKSNYLLGGYDLGSLGLAIKMVGLGIISVNIQAWIISRFCSWKYEWFWQLYGIVFFVGGGFAFKFAYDFIDNLIIHLLFYTVTYFLFFTLIVLYHPQIFGFNKEEIKIFLIKSKKYLI